MKTIRYAIATGSFLLMLALVGCGGGGNDTVSPPAGTDIGIAGGTVTGPSSAQVIVPSGALAQDTRIAIEQSSAGAPALPAGVTPFGPMVAFTPHGTSFGLPVTIAVPFDPDLVPAGTTPVLLKTNAAQTAFEPVPGATVNGASMVAQVSGFSFFDVVGTKGGVERISPIRNWELSVVDLKTSTFTLFQTGPDPLDFGGEIKEIRSRGANVFASLDGDNLSTLEVFSSADGVTFYASAEDGGTAELGQSQRFIKRAENATLQFIITAAKLEAIDGQASIPTPAECPYGLSLPYCHPFVATIGFEAEARTPLGELLPDRNGAPALYTGGFLMLRGRVDLWELSVGRHPDFVTAPWKLKDFEFTKDVDGGPLGERHPRAQLMRNLVFDVDLSRLRVDQEFRVKSKVFAITFKRDGETQVGAYVRDPARTAGTAMNFTGLERVADTAPPLPLSRPAAPCTTGPDPAAGVLQFSAGAYEVLEQPFAGLHSAIFVTRTGGSKGVASAKLTAGEGTATPGVHYTPFATTVHFADGDAEPLLIQMDIRANAAIEPDRTVNLTLSEPGGCASLGAQWSAVLTIVDDDGPPPPPPPSGLDLRFGVDGKAAMPETGTPPRGFGGDRSAMALQADGKIVMVGGTFTDFILARFNADGSLDTGFGVDGRVTTDMGGGPFEQEQALGVAIQGDGKIVVVGHTSIPSSPSAPNLPPTFAVARYNSNGSLDASFGNGGTVSGNVNGIAYAVAIQPDGKIVVAGEFSFPSGNGSDFGDFALARFNANGSLDLGFGGSGTGQVATDIGSSTNSARNIVLQPNGAIVISGKPQGDQPGFDHTDVARYTAAGVLDGSFGSSGKLTFAGANVGEGMVRQANGKFVLVGSVTEATVPATSRFLLKRLNADGSPDTAFGNGGTADSAFTQSAAASGVALQGDGKIVVVGTRVFSPNANFIVARYSADGTLDTGFGSFGNLSIDFFGFSDIGETVLVQPDGKILVSGQAQRNFAGYGLARINP